MRKENMREEERLKEGAPLNSVIGFLYGLTEERNARELPSLESRMRHVTEGVGQLADAVRVEDARAVLAQAAKTTLRLFGALQAISKNEQEFPARAIFIDTLSRKYPASGCGYCGYKPCRCGVKRRQEIAGGKVSPAQKSWSMEAWQQNFGALYGNINYTRGKGFVMLRLISEIGEGHKAFLKFEKATTAEEREKYGREIVAELADSFAWIVGVVNSFAPEKKSSSAVGFVMNLLNMRHTPQPDLAKAPRLEKFLVDTYGDGCPKCKQYPCTCGEFGYAEDRKKQA